jgi:hypothetical protein
MKRVSFATLVGLAILFFSHSAIAMLSREECRRYADEAMIALEYNKVNCGFRGDRWRGEWQNHYEWCVRIVNGEHVRNEWRLRNQQIADCRNVENDCVAYGNTAISQQWTNKNLCPVPCRFGGWHDNRADHEGWCLRVSPQLRRHETEARARSMCFCR